MAKTCHKGPAGDKLEELLQHHVQRGDITDERTARARLRLGYPSWLVLEELGEEVVPTLAKAAGLPTLNAPLTYGLLDGEAALAYGVGDLKSNRWFPLRNGRVAVADPLQPPVDGILAGRPLCVVPAARIDWALKAAFPDESFGGDNKQRLQRYLLEAGAVTEQGLAWALDEQARAGGKLEDILLANGLVEPVSLTVALAKSLGLSPTENIGQPIPLLPGPLARNWRAVALEGDGDDGGKDSPVLVAFADSARRGAVERRLRRPVRAVLTDDENMDELLVQLYGARDVERAISALYEENPELSARSNKFSRPQTLMLAVLGILLLLGLILAPFLVAVTLVVAGSVVYILYTLFRAYCAWQGWKAEEITRPSPEDLASLDDRDLPIYTVMLPVYGEKPATMRFLIESLSNIDYPKHKLDGMLLVEHDDEQTRDAIRKVGKPAWLRVLYIPPSEPRTKPKAMVFGMLYAKGEMLTIYDAEDQPDPEQLKEAIWTLRQTNDSSTVCLQGRLNFYNPRQNLLTRWFTLEYSAWFDMFLPGLHRVGGPIPLGGTSNHFKTTVLREVASWDPYNVTEDADLGLRLFRGGWKTGMLYSTTYEEANSHYSNWIRQRSRWIKGYIQTFFVHTRHPLALYKEMGLKHTLYFFATIGGLICTVLISPVFWVLMLLYLLFQFGWIPALFPGPIYYLALMSLFIGNFFFVFLSLMGAVDRGYDDLAPHAILTPFYWLMMSIAGYKALYEYFFRTHYWQKTEHGLHFGEEEEAAETPQARIHSRGP